MCFITMLAKGVPILKKLDCCILKNNFMVER